MINEKEVGRPVNISSRETIIPNKPTMGKLIGHNLGCIQKKAKTSTKIGTPKINIH